MAEDQFQYIKLPDGSYGKFAADATDATIKAAIQKDFPSAFKQEPYYQAPGLGRINLDPSLSQEQKDQIVKSTGATLVQPDMPQQAAPAQPESMLDKVLRLGKAAGGIALPVAGGLGGAALGAVSPVPGGALMGEMAGSAGGEYLAQKLGLAEPSNAQLALAGAAPIAGRAVGAAVKVLPVSKAGAARQLSKLLPAETSTALFGQAGANELDQAVLQPVVQRVLDSSKKVGKVANDALTDVFDQLTANPKLSLKEAETAKDTIQGYINYYSHFGGTNYNPTVAAELKSIKQTLLGQIEHANPGYLEALDAYAREQNVGRLQTLLSKSSDPAKALKELRSTPLSDLNSKSRMMISGFQPEELDQIQNILERIPKSIQWKQILEGRLAGGAIGGALGASSGGGKEAIGVGVLAGMLGLPIGRRMLTEMIKSGAINNPSAVATAAQVVRAAAARLPQALRSPETSPQ